MIQTCSKLWSSLFGFQSWTNNNKAGTLCTDSWSSCLKQWKSSCAFVLSPPLTSATAPWNPFRTKRREKHSFDSVSPHNSHVSQGRSDALRNIKLSLRELIGRRRMNVWRVFPWFQSLSYVTFSLASCPLSSVVHCSGTQWHLWGFFNVNKGSVSVNIKHLPYRRVLEEKK